MVYECAAKNHQDVTPEWLFEPCEHCGCDIEAVDFGVVEEEINGPLCSTLHRSSSYYSLHPCGHIMVSLMAKKVDTSGLRQP
jgi:hypothetical protein